MGLTALDAWSAQRCLPHMPTRRLWGYLLLRQWSSLTVDRILRLLVYMKLSNSMLQRQVEHVELKRLIKALEKGSPVGLFILRTRDYGRILDNHQVLALAYEAGPTPGLHKIWLYDPNYGQQSVYLELDCSQKPFQIRHSTGENDIGFFVAHNRLSGIFKFLFVRIFFPLKVYSSYPTRGS